MSDNKKLIFLIKARNEFCWLMTEKQLAKITKQICELSGIGRHP